MAPAATLQPIQVPEKEAARLVGVCPRTLYNERKAGRLKYGIVGDKKIVYRLDELDRWSQSRSVESSPAS